MKEITLQEAADEINRLQRLLIAADQAYAKQVAMTARIVLEKEELRKALIELDKYHDFSVHLEPGVESVFDDPSGVNAAYDLAWAALSDADEQKGAYNASKKL